MSTTPPPPSPAGPTPAPTPMTAKEAKAQAKGAKAYAKAQRPFWKKKRVLLPVALIAFVVAYLSLASGGDSSGTTATAGGTTGTTGVSKGAGSKDASADVVVVKLGEADVLGFRKAELQIINNSSKRSNYFIDLSLESPDGKTQYDTASATASNIEPGQSTGGSVLPFTKAKSAPADAVVKVKTVSRLAA